MKVLKILLLLLFLPLILLFRVFRLVVRRRDIVYLPDDHEDMKRAIEQARQTLPHFRRMLANPPPNTKDYALKVRLEAEGGSEHCWIGNIKLEGDKFVGTLANQPEHIAKKLGDVVEASEDMISDWLYLEDGVAQGNFTTKVLLPHVSDKLRIQILQVYGWDKEGLQPTAGAYIPPAQPSLEK